MKAIVPSVGEGFAISRKVALMPDNLLMRGGYCHSIDHKLLLYESSSRKYLGFVSNLGMI